MKLSVVIPAYNEEGSIGSTVRAITRRLEAESIDYEVVVVNDNSVDATGAVIKEIADSNERVIPVLSPYEGGFGLAVRAGLEVYSGDCVAIMMADNSDSPDDLVTYFRVIEAGHDCAFGSRFIEGSSVHDYPKLKLRINRLVNWMINIVFRIGFNDTTNAFKAYRREVIDSVQPLMSKHFNLTVELPLKAVIRGSDFEVVPISWTNRSAGESKLALREMGSRYLFIVLYALLERYLTRGDYLRRPQQAGKTNAGRAHSRAPR